MNKPKQSQSEGRAEELAGHEPVSFDPGQPEQTDRQPAKVIIYVSGGMASVAACPGNVTVEIIDFADLEAANEVGW